MNYERTALGLSTLPAGVSAPTAAGYAALQAVLTAGGGSTANAQALQAWAVAPTANGSVLPICTSNTPSEACATTTDIEIGDIPIQAPAFRNDADLTTSMDFNISDKDQIRGRYVYNKITLIDNAATLPTFYTT